VAGLRRSELEDHQLAFLGDIVQSLVVIDETGGVNSTLYRDGSEIQRWRRSSGATSRQGWATLVPPSTCGGTSSSRVAR
jgi:hypothetical protein